jgi:membrane-bound serine protease (ClpP class)
LTCRRGGLYNDFTVRRFLAFFILCALPAGLAAAVLRATVAAPIHPVTAEYIGQVLARADAEGAALVLLVLDTPGGLDASMRDIIGRLLAARTPVAVYVAPSGARAASAGLFIGLAGDVFAMAPGTNTGAAHPVGLALTGQGMDKTMEEKVTNDASASIKTLAGKRGRNVTMAEDAVRKSLSYTESEALAGGLIDVVAPTEAGLLAWCDGRTIRRFDGSEVRLAVRGEPVVAVPMTFRQRFLLTISNPNLAYLLLMLGLLGLYFEFANPGAIVPGVAGGIALLLAVFAFQILPLNYVGLLLILLALAFFIAEVKVHSYGFLTLGGIAAMLIGSLMLVKSPLPELRPSLGVILPVAVGVSLVLAFLVALVVRAQARRPATGAEGLVGETGAARTDLVPGGKVFVHGELWDAEADGAVRQGEKIKVVRVLEGLRLRVTKVREGGGS